MGDTEIPNGFGGGSFGFGGGGKNNTCSAKVKVDKGGQTHMAKLNIYGHGCDVNEPSSECYSTQIEASFAKWNLEGNFLLNIKLIFNLII